MRSTVNSKREIETRSGNSMYVSLLSMFHSGAEKSCFWKLPYFIFPPFPMFNKLIN